MYNKYEYIIIIYTRGWTRTRKKYYNNNTTYHPPLTPFLTSVYTPPSPSSWGLFSFHYRRRRPCQELSGPGFRIAYLHHRATAPTASRHVGISHVHVYNATEKKKKKPTQRPRGFSLRAYILNGPLLEFTNGIIFTIFSFFCFFFNIIII